MEPEGCRPCSLEARITVGSYMTVDFSSHSHTEPLLSSQICHQTPSEVVVQIEKVCCHRKSIMGEMGVVVVLVVVVVEVVKAENVFMHVHVCPIPDLSESASVWNTGEERLG